MSEEPFIVTARGLHAAIIVEGPNKGLPIAVVMAIANGSLDRKDVDRRGWRYARFEEATP